MHFKHLRLVPGAERIPHPDRPNAARDARERDVFHVETAIEKEGKTRTEFIHRNTAGGHHFGISKTVRRRMGSLLHRRRSRLADVITADGNGIPARHLARGKFHHVGEKTEGSLDWKDGFVLRLNFLED